MFVYTLACLFTFERVNHEVLILHVTFVGFVACRRMNTEAVGHLEQNHTPNLGSKSHLFSRIFKNFESEMKHECLDCTLTKTIWLPCRPFMNKSFWIFDIKEQFYQHKQCQTPGWSISMEKR